MLLVGGSRPSIGAPKPVLIGLFSQAIASLAYLRHSRSVEAHRPSRRAASASHPGHTQPSGAHAEAEDAPSGGGGGAKGEGESSAPRAMIPRHQSLRFLLKHFARSRAARSLHLNDGTVVRKTTGSGMLLRSFQRPLGTVTVL